MKTCYYDWLRGKLKDHHAQSIRIEKVLREGLPQGFKPRRGEEQVRSRHAIPHQAGPARPLTVR